MIPMWSGRSTRLVHTVNAVHGILRIGVPTETRTEFVEESQMALPAQDNKDVVRQFIEDAWNDADLDLVDALVSADAPHHDPTLPERSAGPAGRKQSIQLYHAAFPDVHIDIEEMVAEDDLVAARWTGRGTHEGELMGIEPTGAAVEVAGISLNRVTDGRIVETWEVYDTLGMLRQIGAIPDQPTGEPRPE
jgi:steroid delta-isomerase-like uncharacterized protein